MGCITVLRKECWHVREAAENFDASVAPGSVRTPLLPSTYPADEAAEFGGEVIGS